VKGHHRIYPKLGFHIFLSNLQENGSNGKTFLLYAQGGNPV